MNKFLTTALSLAAVGSVGAADPGDSDWLKLDSEINGLANTMAARDGNGYSALIRFNYLYGDDEITTTNSGSPNDASGFGLYDIDLAFFGGFGKFTYLVSADLDSGTAVLENAYARWAIGDAVAIRGGQFKSNVLRSSNVDPENQLFFNRTILGSKYDRWDAGAEVSGSAGLFSWSLGLQNGDTQDYADHFYALAFGFDFGTGAGDFEGARGGNGDFNATAGLSVTNDDTGGPGAGAQTNIFLSLNGNAGAIGFGAEVGFLDDNATGGLGGDFAGIFSSPDGLTRGAKTNGGSFFTGDSTPYSLTLSYLLHPNVEFGIRYEKADNMMDHRFWTFGASFYQEGHNAKYQISVTDASSATVMGVRDPEGFYAQAGVTVGASR